jgi:hypothetical protein
MAIEKGNNFCCFVEIEMDSRWRVGRKIRDPNKDILVKKWENWEMRGIEF